MTSPHDDSIINQITTSASIVSTNDDSTQDDKEPLTTTAIGTDASLVANASTATHHMVNNQVSTTNENASNCQQYER